MAESKLAAPVGLPLDRVDGESPVYSVQRLFTNVGEPSGRAATATAGIVSIRSRSSLSSRARRSDSAVRLGTAQTQTEKNGLDRDTFRLQQGNDSGALFGKQPTPMCI
jgi:S1-C subfamily serine protease